MRFFSDNAAPVCPQVLAALADANTLDTAYDGDRWSAQLDERFSSLFETRVRVLWVPTGTAANALALAALCPPHGGVICHRDAHIQNDEFGATEFYSGGMKIIPVANTAGIMDPAALTATIARYGGRFGIPTVLSLTNATECGTVYTPAEIAALKSA